MIIFHFNRVTSISLSLTVLKQSILYHTLNTFVVYKDNINKTLVLLCLIEKEKKYIKPVPFH